MTAKKESYPGKCLLCERVLEKHEMEEHLRDCIATRSDENGKTVKFFHIQVESPHMPMYWLHIDIPGAMTLAHLDSVLRNIWLECCGHLSCFEVNGERYASHPAEDKMFMPSEEGMSKKLYNVLDGSTEFDHEYDYGSTTALHLSVLECSERQVKKPEITLLARNEDPDWKCAECGKPATQIEATGWGIDLDSLFCDECVGDDEELFLPLVNSPRTGVCGYC